jgi:hypothetical protein
MVDAPDNVIFEHLRRLDTKLDHVIEVIGDMKIRMTAVEERIAQVERLRGSTAAAIESKRGWIVWSGALNCRIEVMT